MLELFKLNKPIKFDVLLKTDPKSAWEAWLVAEKLADWWGPEGTDVTRCEINPVVGGEIYVVMTAGSSMGKYAGTEWPMQGQFTVLIPFSKIEIEATSWTEGKKIESLIEHTINVEFIAQGENTQMLVNVTIHRHGPKAKLAAYGLKYGYKAQFKKLSGKF